MVIGGIFFELLPVLLILMGLIGPTPVAGTNGTTAAFLKSASHVEQRLK